MKTLYPQYYDFDLKENFFLNKITVVPSCDDYMYYSVYTSLNGRDFDFAAGNNPQKISCSETGDVYNIPSTEARIIRVYVQYSEKGTTQIKDVLYEGAKSNTPVLPLPKINVVDFKDSVYNVEVTDKDTYDEIYGMIERNLGEKYKSKFILSKEPNPHGDNIADYFILENANDKILIRGNEGVCIAAGLNHYLKYYCNVHISQVGNQTKMPDVLPKILSPLYKCTKAKIRHAYSCCTHAYTMAFWGKKEWRKDLDWLALNGVNVIFDITAQEEVWRRFLSKIGYSHEEIRRFVAGPAYCGWAVKNLYGFGGPVHDSWFEERTELARENHRIMKKLGMKPLLQGYGGIIPCDIEKYDKDVETIKRNHWNGFERPLLIRPTDKSFSKYASLFYESQKEVYGTYSNYYMTEPFVEGGIGTDNPKLLRDSATAVLNEMTISDPDAVWVLQAWGALPYSDMLSAIDEIDKDKKHVFVLDLQAERDPKYVLGDKDNKMYGYSKEFDSTPWVYCMLNNFGGRMGLHGHLDRMADDIPKVFDCTSNIAGVGVVPEASCNNPVLYDFLFESAWTDATTGKIKSINLRKWLYDYADRRYGKVSDKAHKAWDIMLDTVYKAEFNDIGEGAPESIVNARPDIGIKAASFWGNSQISYDKNKFKKAAELLLCDYELLKKSEGYMYDLTTTFQQVLSNASGDIYEDMVRAYENKNPEEFKKHSDKFLKITGYMERVTKSNPYYLLGKWLNEAKALANDDFSKKVYEFNAKAQITTWGSYENSETGHLHDYSNKQWSGLIKDFYKPRWERWIEERIKELSGKDFEKEINWFEKEWRWVISDFEYPLKATDADLYKIGNEIIEFCHNERL
ncbi:MAG: alpha-N-acetylglucosaminidase [Clostridia bacterium]|nr:alpha-N-acetylglucosaminidase [Clostridia bacterium]